MVAAAVVADLSVGRAVANRDFVTEAVASGTLRKRFRVDGDLHGTALVIHISWFGKELTECQAGGVVNHDVDGAGSRLRIGGRVRCPSWAVIEGESCGRSSAR